jgi:arylformamidase
MRTEYLSHVLANDTPLYGGQGEIIIRKDKSISNGDLCNTSILQVPAHSGTHVDAPYHFLNDRKSIDEFEADKWIFDSVICLEVDIRPGELIKPESISKVIDLAPETNFILFKTGFEKYREQEIYWCNAPGISPEVIVFLLEQCPILRAVGMDFISISSLSHRETGREAHRAFLGKDILLFEDMRLSGLNSTEKIKEIIALPLRFDKGDGSPFMAIAFL